MRNIGPEPSGATPIEGEDLEGLIPDFVATRADLNQVEFENITAALPWARASTFAGPEGILDYGFMLTLHRRMFGDVWSWAGTLRQRVTNIGVEPHLIPEQSKQLLDDAKFWHAELSSATTSWRPGSTAAWSVHPFPNGNGRCTRMMADLYLVAIGREPFAWGSASLDVDGSVRAAYIAALVKAVDTDEYSDLVRRCRGPESLVR